MQVVSDLTTDPMNGKRPFEERVFARFDAVDSAVRNLDSRLQTLGVRADDTNSRLQKLEIRASGTKPIWELALHVRLSILSVIRLRSSTATSMTIF